MQSILSVVMCNLRVFVMRFLLDDKKNLTKTQMETLMSRMNEFTGWQVAITVMKHFECAPRRAPTPYIDPVTGDTLTKKNIGQKTVCHWTLNTSSNGQKEQRSMS